MAARRQFFNIDNLCIAILYFIPSGRVKAALPPALSLSEVLPGVTMGGIYAARFKKSDNEYVSELGIMRAYAACGDKKGFFVSEFFSDGKTGADAGRADFAWGFEMKNMTLSVSSGSELLINLKMSPLLKQVPFTSVLPFLCVKGENVSFMRNHLITKIGISSSSVDIPEGSPLSNMPLGVKVLSTFWDSSNIITKEPEYATKRAMKPADLRTPIGKST